MDDYKGRKVQLTEEVFKRHTTKKYEEARVPLVECIPDVLKNPERGMDKRLSKEVRQPELYQVLRG